MANLPATKVGQLEWFEARAQAWADNAVAIGLTTVQTGGFKTLVSAARTKIDAMMTVAPPDNSARRLARPPCAS